MTLLTEQAIRDTLTTKIMARQRSVGRYRKARHPRTMDGGKYVIGTTYNNQAICFIPEADRHNLSEMFHEVHNLGLERPIHVYGHSCTIWADRRSFIFHQIDEDGNEL
jgi:hypothetical protein